MKNNGKKTSKTNQESSAVQSTANRCYVSPSDSPLDFGFYNMDCMEGMGKFPDNYFDLAIVDPPYGVGKFWEGGDSKNFNYGRDRQQNKDWNEKIPSADYFQELERCTKHRIIWGWNYYTEHIGSSDSLIFWDKKMGAPNYSAGEIAWTSFNHKIRIYEKSRNSERNGQLAIHPCQKPVQLYRWCLKNYAQTGWKILDTHVGSGSSLIACEWEGFDYVGFEIDADYYAAAVKRIETWRKGRTLDMFKSET